MTKEISSIELAKILKNVDQHMGLNSLVILLNSENETHQRLAWFLLQIDMIRNIYFANEQVIVQLTDGLILRLIPDGNLEITYTQPMYFGKFSEAEIDMAIKSSKMMDVLDR